MCAGRFRGHKSSNRIELSQFVQELFWCFGLPVALGKGQVGGGGGMGGVPTHMHMHAHTRTCTHAHLYMYRNCKWPPTWRHPCLACLTCMCVHVCMHGTPPHTHTHPHPHPPICHPPGGWTPRIT